MKSNKTNVLVLLLNLIIPSLLFSQSNSDLELWNSAAVEISPIKKLDLELELQYRLKENISVTDSYFTELTADYEFFKDFKMGIGTRFIRKNDNQGRIQGYENHFRFHLQAKYNYKADNLGMGLRLRYQNKDELGIQDEFGNFSNHNLRLKAGLNYEIESLNLTPEVSAEIFYNKEGNNSALNKYRLTMGLEYKINKKNKIELAMRRENLIYVSPTESVNIIMLAYKYKI